MTPHLRKFHLPITSSEKHFLISFVSSFSYSPVNLTWAQPLPCTQASHCHPIKRLHVGRLLSMAANVNTERTVVSKSPKTWSIFFSTHFLIKHLATPLFFVCPSFKFQLMLHMLGLGQLQILPIDVIVVKLIKNVWILNMVRRSKSVTGMQKSRIKFHCQSLAVRHRKLNLYTALYLWV